MSRASSNFLQGANAANAAAQAAKSDPGGRPPEDVDVLAAVDLPEVNDIETLAKHFGIEETKVKSAVHKLSKLGLIDMKGVNLKLSRGGERALRYMSLAKF
ncbi:MAG TPA: hypothetical protein VEA60_01180 [Allosphingosinicella sp.]|nr:hypothetical protein [Allosphingosinicella sp.]